MDLLTLIIFYTLLGSVFSLVGGILLLVNRINTIKISHLLSSFAAGTLLGTAFFDLLPEALEESGEMNIFLWALIGILSFFILERLIHWFHHHEGFEAHEKTHKHTVGKPTVPLIIFGDSVHNFIDGVTIAATFMASIPLGIVTTLAVAAHEIPQEIGDFGILLKKGMKKKTVLLVNIISAITSVVGAVLTFFLGSRIENFLPIFLSLTAGFFIYIAASDLIPEIHEENRKGFALIETILLLLGVGTIYVLVELLHSLNLH